MINHEEIKKFEGKKVAIKTKDGSFFKTDNLVYCETYIVFRDKFNLKVIVECDNISSIQELSDNAGWKK